MQHNSPISTTHNQSQFWPRLQSACSVISLRNWPLVILLSIGAILMLAPFAWMFAASMRPAGEAYQLPPSFFPTKFSLDSYNQVASGPMSYWAMYRNSLIVSTFATCGAIITSAMAAFAFSRLRFPGSGLIFGFVLLGLMVPYTLTLIPLYYGMATFNLLDSLWSLILPGIAAPVAIFMMRQFMVNQPRELEEAAFVDGASYWTIFWRISLPQLKPPIAALTIILFSANWNNFILPLVFVRKANVMTLPVGLMALQDSFGLLSLSAMMAGVTMAVIPLFVIFLIAQRFILESIASTGIKA